MSIHSATNEVVGTNLLTAAVILATLFLLVAILGSGSVDFGQTSSAANQSAAATTAAASSNQS
jgi:hypothetical protein